MTLIFAFGNALYYALFVLLNIHVFVNDILLFGLSVFSRIPFIMFILKQKGRRCKTNLPLYLSGCDLLSREHKQHGFVFSSYSCWFMYNNQPKTPICTFFVVIKVFTIWIIENKIIESYVIFSYAQKMFFFFN